MKLRFSLRALFFVMTLLCVGLILWSWFVCQRGIVEARKELLSQLVERGGGYLLLREVTPESLIFHWQGNVFEDDVNQRNLQARPATPGLIRRWLGDTTVHIVWIPWGQQPIFAEQIATTFPEAVVRRHLCGYTRPRGPGVAVSRDASLR